MGAAPGIAGGSFAAFVGRVDPQEGRSAGRCTGVRCHLFRAFGLAVDSELALPGIALGRDDGSGLRVRVRMVEPTVLDEAWSGTEGPPVWETVLGDGVAIQHEMGTAGDHRFRYGGATFHISADARVVLCAAEDPADPAWQRQLLDTILFSASFANGFELLHASAVEYEAGVVAFMAGSGGGKSSIAAELVRRGRRLFCDDVLAIGHGPDGLQCHPAPAVMNLPSASGAPEELAAAVVASFPEEGELWVALREAATSPRPLAAVYVIDRNANEQAVSDVEGRAFLHLLAHAISLPHDLERARNRFSVFSTLAARTPVRLLAAPPDAAPAALADLIEASLAEHDAPLVGAMA